MTDFLLGLFLTMLPDRFRKRWSSNFAGDIRTASVVSGLAQALSCVSFAAVRYYAFFNEQIRLTDERLILGAAQQGGDTAVRAMGIVFLVAYLFRPLTLVLAYFAIEGVVRMLAAVVTGEAVGTLPLYLIDYATAKAKDSAREAAMGRRVADEVREAPEGEQEWCLMIASCRPKPNWNELMTISYNNHLYEVARELEGEPPHRFVYLLRKAPQYKVVRGLHHYDPEEALR